MGLTHSSGQSRARPPLSRSGRSSLPYGQVALSPSSRLDSQGHCLALALLVPADGLSTATMVLCAVEPDQSRPPVGEACRRWRGRQKCESVGCCRSHIANTLATCLQICYYHWTGTTLVVCNCAGYLSCAVDCVSILYHTTDGSRLEVVLAFSSLALWPDADAALTDEN
ncbi:hypothetical protein EV363DRAFT_153151 [Boletus edulis]|nr:hypothetical protein EV363DRAFT_153151 [Boletus edulis]